MDDTGSQDSREKRIEKERARIPEALRLIEERGAQDFGRGAPKRLRGLAGVEALLQTSWEIRYDDPREMVFRAGLASTWAQTLDPKRYGAAFVRDVQGRALIELGNAHRVADELDAAQKILGEATRVIEEGTGDQLLEARLCDVQASLYADRRFFTGSCEALDAVRVIHERRGDRHLAGRALISKSLYTMYQGNIAEAEELVRRGLELIDQEREPSVFLCAAYNQLTLMIEQNHFQEAGKQLFLHRPRFMATAGKLQLLKLRAVEGRIAFGTGRLDRAEAIFREVRQAFEKDGLGYSEALATLELAAVLQRAGRDAEVFDLVVEASNTFTSLGVRREALGAMLVLRKANERGLPTPGLLQSTIRFLMRFESNPDLIAEDFVVP